MSKTVIYLDEGATLNRIVNPLENGAVYQVDTPNSTMAVRGTVFRVEVREGKDGKIYTYLAVLNGAVKVELKTDRRQVQRRVGNHTGRNSRGDSSR